MENGGDRAVSEKIIGRQIWDFVKEFDTQSFLNAIFFFCRRQAGQFETTYRCDSPDEMRLFRMEIEPQDDGVLLIRHILVSNPRIINLDTIVPIEDRIGKTRCSMCNRFWIKNAWIDAFDVANVKYTARRHTVCLDCKAAARKQLDTISSVSEFELRPGSNSQ